MPGFNVLICFIAFLPLVIGFVPQSMRLSYIPTQSSRAPSLPFLVIRHGLANNDDAAESLPIDMNQLQSRIEQQQNHYCELLMTTESDTFVRPQNVHIILFHPDTDDQGVHTIEFPKGSGLNIILAFESGIECAKFSRMLKQDSMQFFDPVPTETALDELELFCEAMGLPIKVVPKGRDLRPPSDTVEKLYFDPNHGKEGEEADTMGSWE